MPTPSLSELGNNPSLKQVTDYIVKLQRDLEWLLLNLDDLNVKRVRAEAIFTGTLDANVVTIRSDLTSGYIQIDGNGLVINNGSFNTFTADINGKVTMTSALIKSALGYPYVTMDPNGDLLGAYESASSYITITPTGTANGSPQFSLVGGGGNVYLYHQSGKSLMRSSGNLILSTQTEDIDLTPDRHVNIDFNQLCSFDNISLSSRLNSKANMGQETSTDGYHNHGIPDGTELMIAGGGTVTFVSSGSHSHTQT